MDNFIAQLSCLDVAGTSKEVNNIFQKKIDSLFIFSYVIAHLK